MPVLELLELVRIVDALSGIPASSTAPKKPPAAVERAAPRLPDNFADAMRDILRCYHPSAKYQMADVVNTPWDRQQQYGAHQSAVVRISYSGVSGTRYAMNVAVMSRPGEVRAHVIADNAAIPGSKKCSLQDWVSVEPTKKPG